MSYQATFKRYELKYLLTDDDKEYILDAMQGHMIPDIYGETTVRNVYFDTDSFRLIRRSLEKPAYKEKLRVRSYSEVSPDDLIFVELKKKYHAIVYKRRLMLPEREVMQAFADGTPLPDRSQIADEIEYFRRYYTTLEPRVFLTYDRQAFCQADGGEVRITFDKNILYRTDELSLSGRIYGKPLLRPNETLMEIKTPDAIPMWMVDALSKRHIYRTSFSKYGEAYTQMQKEKANGGTCYA